MSRNSTIVQYREGEAPAPPPPAIARALKNPPFLEASFTATKHDTAAAKADFANKLMKFLAADCPWTMFSNNIYNGLHLHYGHIAHFNRLVFFENFFLKRRDKIEFLDQTCSYPSYGSPDYTWCDVEKATIARIRQSGLERFYRAQKAEQDERRERATLAHLQAKYAPIPPPVHVRKDLFDPG